jgi:hypothetical protein
MSAGLRAGMQMKFFLSLVVSHALTGDLCARPAQYCCGENIPAGVIDAPGSHLGCLTGKRTLGDG